MEPVLIKHKVVEDKEKTNFLIKYINIIPVKSKMHKIEQVNNLIKGYRSIRIKLAVKSKNQRWIKKILIVHFNKSKSIKKKFTHKSSESSKTMSRIFKTKKKNKCKN